MKHGKIKGAKRTKGRELSGHPLPLEHRTFQDTPHDESVDRTMRKWRPEPQLSGHPDPGVHHLVARLREKIGRVAPDLLDGASSLGDERSPKPEPVAAAGPGKTVERTWGGWIYTINWPGGEIIDKRKEV